MKIPGLSFSLKRAVGITAAKQKIARKTGIPTTKQGLQRKVGGTILNAITGKRDDKDQSKLSRRGVNPASFLRSNLSYHRSIIYR